MNLDERLINVQSWWIASELLRRHPDLGLIETHPGGGTYDCLTVVEWAAQPSRRVDLNRNGSIHVAGSGGAFSWADERGRRDRHWALKTIERAAGLDAPTKTPAATPRSLIFRFCYRVVLSALNTRDTWDVRCARIDSSGDVFSNGDVDGFPTAAQSARSVRNDDPYGDGLYRFWKVLRAGEVVLLADIDGLLHHRAGPPTDISKRYAQLNRSMARLTASVVPVDE